MNVKNLFKNVLYQLGLITDYVVEQGTDGIWTYKKWASGIAECCGRDTKSHAINTAWGGVYYEAVNSYYLTYPSGFFISSPEVVLASIINSSGTAWIADYGSGQVGTSSRTPSYTFCRGTSSASVQITLCVNAIGRWK